MLINSRNPMVEYAALKFYSGVTRPSPRVPAHVVLATEQRQSSDVGGVTESVQRS